jgi:putative spermidine/putrescine transport system ATP-binding protein
MVALAPTDLVIEPGEFFSLIGPSGSGKSTLLGAIAGFLPPTAGRIDIDGEDVVGVPPYKRNIGMVFQNYALFPHMSVFENVAFPLRLRKLGEGEIQQRVKRMLATVRLAELGSRTPAQLSGGQQQRVALARAAVYDPRVLLMDEPLGALDKNLREEMQYEIKQFHAVLGTTIVYVTHDQDEAATMSNRIAIMRDGRIAQVGRPRELYDKPRNAFVAGFLGEANLFDVGEVKPNGGGSLAIRTKDGLVLSTRHLGVADEGALVACIRPESLSLRTRDEAGHTSSETRIAGRIEDVVFTAGTVRYRVAANSGARLTIKLPAQRQHPQFDVGQPVMVRCAADDVLLIPKE